MLSHFMISMSFAYFERFVTNCDYIAKEKNGKGIPISVCNLSTISRLTFKFHRNTWPFKTSQFSSLPFF